QARGQPPHEREAGRGAPLPVLPRRAAVLAVRSLPLLVPETERLAKGGGRGEQHGDRDQDAAHHFPMSGRTFAYSRREGAATSPGNARCRKVSTRQRAGCTITPLLRATSSSALRAKRSASIGRRRSLSAASAGFGMKFRSRPWRPPSRIAVRTTPGQSTLPRSPRGSPSSRSASDSPSTALLVAP